MKIPKVHLSNQYLNFKMVANRNWHFKKQSPGKPPGELCNSLFEITIKQGLCCKTLLNFF